MKFSKKLFYALTSTLTLFGLNNRRSTVDVRAKFVQARPVAGIRNNKIYFGLGIISILVAWFTKLSPIKQMAVIAIITVACLAIFHGPILWFIIKSLSIVITNISELARDFIKTLSWFKFF